MVVVAPAAAVADHQQAEEAVALRVEATLHLQEPVHPATRVDRVPLREAILPGEAVHPVVVHLQEEARDVNNTKD